VSLAFYIVNGDYIKAIVFAHNNITRTCLMMGVLKDDIGSVGCRVSRVNSPTVVFPITKEGCWSDFDNFRW
jgi:hypothetical protein